MGGLNTNSKYRVKLENQSTNMFKVVLISRVVFKWGLTVHLFMYIYQRTAKRSSMHSQNKTKNKQNTKTKHMLILKKKSFYNRDVLTLMLGLVYWEIHQVPWWHRVWYSGLHWADLVYRCCRSLPLTLLLCVCWVVSRLSVCNTHKSWWNKTGIHMSLRGGPSTYQKKKIISHFHLEHLSIIH